MVELIARLNASLQGRYRVDRELGAGGMATVFLARDLRHHRDVALKVLKPELYAAIGAERFLAEIRTTAALQHPNILPLHDSGEADSLLFYTMPFVEGETLRQRLDREGRLPVDEAVRLALDMAEALDLAHQRGVVHRDVKPSNILLSHGRAVVADFGIARVRALSETARLTQTGTSIGTIGYMSPEQASGDPAIDHRADVYSLGCVLYEMLAGEPPYGGDSLVQVLMRQATEAVPSVRARRPEVAVALDRAVSTALAKEPTARFASAAALAAALRGMERTGAGAARAAVPSASAAGQKQRTTVVVLPFVNRSADPEDEYFSDGLTDEVISDLALVSALRVISRNSSMALKGTTKDTPTLARELGITHLVSGTVRRAGTALRVTAELVEAASDTPLWSRKFTGTMDDVFGIQEDISRQIVAALSVELSDREVREVEERPIEDPVAYDSYLRACQLMYVWTPEAQSRAERLVDEAIGIAGEAPLLLAMKAQLQWNLVNISIAPAAVALPRAAELAGRALELQPDCHLAIFVRGLVAANGGRPEEGLVDLVRAHRMRPNDANVLVELGRFSLSAGLDFRERWERLVEIDPLSPTAHLLVALYFWFMGPRERAAAPARRAVELAPDPSMLHVESGWLLAAAGQSHEGLAVLGRVAASVGLFTEVRTFASVLLAALEGDEEAAVRAATPDWEAALSNEINCFNVVEAWAKLGHGERALRMAQQAVRLGFLNYPMLASAFARLRDDPSLRALLDEIEPRWRALVAWHQGEDATIAAPSGP